MKRGICILIAMMVCFSSCKSQIFPETKRADEVLQTILSEFSVDEGYLYSDALEAERPLTDAMLERMFSGADLADFRYACSMAVYFSKRYSEHEIIVIELFDMSHRGAVEALLRKRMEKKENAVVISNGVYVYLICTDQNDEIKNYVL